jgi:hypothetical protein
MSRIVAVVFVLLVIRLIPRGLRREAQFVKLSVLLVEFLAAATSPTTNSSKTYSTEARTAALETRTGNLEQGIIPNVGGSTVNVGTMNSTLATHTTQIAAVTTTANTANTNANSANTVISNQISGTGVLHTDVLSEFTDQTVTAFLATLTQIGPQSFPGGNDSNIGGTWASGERGYVNNSINSLTAVMNGMINHNFMAS